MLAEAVGFELRERQSAAQRPAASRRPGLPLVEAVVIAVTSAAQDPDLLGERARGGRLAHEAEHAA